MTMKGLNMKQNRIFYQIFIPILTLATISIIIITSFVSYNSTKKMQQILDLSVKDNLQQLVFNIENDLTLLESTLTAFSTSTSYNDIVSSPLLPQNIKDYRSILNQVQYLEALNGNNNVTYSITSIDGKWNIRNGTLRQLTSNDLDQLKKEVESINQSTRQIIWSNKEGKISFTAYLPYFSINKNSIASGSIDEKTLIESVDSNTTDNLAILNRSGDILLAQKDFPIPLEDLFSQIKSENKNQGIIDIKNKKYYFATNSLGNRYYIIQYDSLANKIHQDNNLLIVPILSTLAILVISFTSYVVAKKIATPISKLKKSIESLPFSGQISSENVDDLTYLSTSIQAIVDEQETFNQFYESGKTILKNQFIVRLLNNQVSKHTIDNRLKVYDYNIRNEVVYFVLLTKIDFLRTSDDTNLDLWYFGINQVIKETIDPQYILESTILNSDTQVTILILDANNTNQHQDLVLQFANTMIQSISTVLKLQVSIGISNGYEHLEDLHIGYKEALQALQQKRNFSDSSVVTFADINNQGNDLLLSFYPEDIESKIKEEILIGNKTKALELVDLFFSRLKEYATSSVSVEIASIRLINTLLMLNEQLGLQKIKNIQARQSSSIYQRVTEFQNIHHIKRIIIEEIIVPMIDENQEHTDNIFKTLSNEIKNIIKQNYDLDITLESIADELHYNPNYLSNIFKKEVGISFTDYLNNYRLKMAKQLLIETDLSIKDIAEKLRYTNSQNFIRFFKKIEGTTPGQYRKENKKL